MSRWPKLSQETITLHLNNKAWEVWPNDWVKIITDSKELASVFGKEVLLVPFDWLEVERGIKV